ncbi:hypothetical protein EIP91_011546 [Steccherinum ochraceum]|uniref:Uncharacterized protein n=1 Tax=Steccherinum ochraceum TaxID=92696 RepID=A0A4R0RM52_9APHY|nr:hypothetical protein EIP91_011546 [Steccherinum ochraceum]
MSFQHFRIQPTPQQQPISHSTNASSSSDSSLSQALGHPTTAHPTGPSPTIIQGFHLESIADGAKKSPYGSGDIDDGYTLVFESMDAFQAWRRQEEEEKTVEFVKGDTHGSKAVPPRFKDHTKLVCARHSRSGRKKYVKKYPDRVRKVPSRKIEGTGCPASISFKTYFDSDEVRACYMSEHSHETGLANLPFTRKGRKAQAEQARSRGRASHQPMSDSTEPSATPPAIHAHMNDVASPPLPPLPVQHSVASTSSASSSLAPALQPPVPVRPPAAPPQLQHPQFQHAVSMAAPLPPSHQPPPPSRMDLTQERWDRMSVLFQTIRDRARDFEYPVASVAALETVLIRLYLETPMAGGSGHGVPQNMSSLSMHGMGD